MKKGTIAVVAVVATALIGAGCGSSSSNESGSSASSNGYGNKTASNESGSSGKYTAKAPTEAKETSGSVQSAGEAEFSGKPAVVSVSNTSLGKVLVDSRGFTLYDFHKDKGGKSSCYGACMGAWPPLLTGGEPTAKGGAMASQLGTTKRKEGTTQVTYAGHPLYTYTADSKPGDTLGNDVDTFGGQWYALLPSGEEAGG